MPKYYNFKMAANGRGVLLYHSDGVDYMPSKVVAEQKLLSSVHSWAGENTDVARGQMDLLTKLVRMA